MPTLVERRLDGYVGCGVLARGFARVRCGACGHELLDLDTRQAEFEHTYDTAGASASTSDP
jgi:uncharacterized ferredoxin-like protein